MSKTKESRHAAKLRELGFVPFMELRPEVAARSKKDAEAFQKNLMTILNRAQRRKLKKLAAKPSFTVTEGVTWVQDELGNDWVAEEEINLSYLEFTDNVAWAKQVGIFPQGPLH